MIEFLTTHWFGVINSLITAGALGFCSWAWGQIKTYRELLEEKEDDRYENMVEEKIQPLIDSIIEIKNYISQMEEDQQDKLNVIISSYAYRLTQLCQNYISKGEISQEGYSQLLEFYSIYCDLGGKDQGLQQYYEKAKRLPIVKG